MRRVTLIAPFLASAPGEESALRALPEAVRRVVEQGEVFKIRPMEQASVPELAFFGIDPTDHPIAQGPLTVSALGHSPPEGSVHFHLTLCSVDEGGNLQPADAKDQAIAVESGGETEVDRIFEAAERLNTPVLTVLRGEGADHALVWEAGSLENASQPPAKVYGRPALENAPAGEGEQLLRRFIDDSVNILSALDLNHVRREEGLAPLNCLWPWGQGFRPDLPNLPLRRGDVAWVESGSMRIQGLARLVGYRHGNRKTFGGGLRTDFGRIRAAIERNRLVVAVFSGFEEMQRHHRPDEIAWNLERLSEAVVGPLLEDQERSPFELRIVAPGGTCTLDSPPERASSVGLALMYSSKVPRVNGLPFDERALDDSRVAEMRVWELVHPGLIGSG